MLRLLLSSLLLILVFSFSGCGAKVPHGRWNVSREAMPPFTQAQVLKDHKYYYTGSKAMPDAIIALRNDLQLRSRLWVPIQISTRQLTDWNMMFSMDHSMVCPFQSGYIQTSSGEYAGMWFGKDTINTVRSPEPGVIEIYLPYSAPGSMCDQEKVRRER